MSTMRIAPIHIANNQTNRKTLLDRADICWITASHVGRVLVLVAISYVLDTLELLHRMKYRQITNMAIIVDHVPL